MTESVRKRTSKWDLVPESHFSSETVQENDLSGKAVDSHHEKESRAGWGPLKNSETLIARLPDMEVDDIVSSKDSSGRSCWEHIAGSKDGGKEGNANRGGDGSPTKRISRGDHGYSRCTSPELNAWGQASSSRSPRSPRSGWNRSRRSRSRSRSRSPPHGFRRERQDWNHRGGNGAGGSNAPCRDFAKGRCRRGSQCRFLHQDSHAYDDKRHYEGKSTEGRASKQDRGRSPGYAGIGSQEQSDHSRDKPSHGFGSHYDGEREKHDLSRNRRSSIRCNDFLKGKCYRGSKCKYVHDTDCADDYGGRSSKERARSRVHDRRESDMSFSHDEWHEPPRNSDIPCKFFAEGRCRKAEDCRFSHQGRSRVDDWSHSLGTEDRSWDGPNWSGETPVRNVRTSPHWDDPENRSGDGSTWGNKESDKGISNSFQSGHNSGAIDVSKNELWEDKKWGGDKASSKNTSNPPQWKSNAIGDVSKSGLLELRDTDKFLDATGVPLTGTNEEGFTYNMDIQEPIHNHQDLQSQNREEGIKHPILPKEALHINLPAFKQNTTPEASGRQQEQLSEVPMHPSASGNVFVQQHPGLKASGVMLFPCGESNKATDSIKPQNVMTSANNLPAFISAPGQCFKEQKPSDAQSSIPNGNGQWVIQNLDPNAQTQQIVLPLNQQDSYPNGQSQQIVFRPPIGQNFNPNWQINQQMIPQPPSTARPPTLLNQVELAKRPSLPDVDMPPIAFETPAAQNAVTSEQFSQITDLSSSLAQIFGNGPQLPQLYASLSNLSAAGLVPSLPYSQPNTMQPPAPTVAPSIQQNQRCSPQNQCEPLCNSMEPVNPDINDEPPGFSSNSFLQKNVGIENSQACSNSLVSLSATGTSNDSDHHGSGGQKEKLHQENQESRDSAAEEVNEETNGESEKEQQTGHLKDTDADDGQVDDESKRSNDGKAMRMFRFALVEFVKELLKPAWKEGHMSKEAYKSIVKKAVDKVTGAMQGPNVPQTQEKIDHYLSYSKPKLTKLVQAYVEKYSKI